MQEKYPEAWTLHEESLELSRTLRYQRASPLALSGLGAVQAAVARPDDGTALVRTGRLLGAVAALVDGMGAVLLPHERAPYEQARAAVRTARGEAAFAAAWAAGRALSIDEALGEALGAPVGQEE